MISSKRGVCLMLLALAGMVAVACGLPAIGVHAARPKAEPAVVLAAASLQEALDDAANRWAAKGHPRPRLSFAASSALARQVMAGAPADLFASADEAWMDELAARRLIAPDSRANLAENRLVLVAPRNSPARLTIGRSMAIGAALGAGGRLAVADVEAVPAGRYARAALTRLGVWPQVAARLAPAESVRAALALVSRGECRLGVVYATDAMAEPGVRVIGTFPAASHPPIVYPIARLASSHNPEAEGFRRFLLSAEGKALMRRRGFAVP